MSTGRWFALGSIAIIALVVLVAVMRPGTESVPGASAGSIATSTPTASPSPSASASPAASVRPKPSPTPTTAAPSKTKPPRASGEPRVAYAEFVLRVDGDRATVDRLDGALATATDARDLTAVRIAAVDILDFVDLEHDWLREHPPAECYAPAHASANAMLDAFGTAADRFVSWSATAGGLAGLTALGRAVDAAGAAADALSAFGKVLAATTCPA